MAGCDALHFEILGGVAGQLQHLGRQVLQNGRAVHGSRCTHPAQHQDIGNPMNVTFMNAKFCMESTPWLWIQEGKIKK